MASACFWYALLNNACHNLGPNFKGMDKLCSMHLTDVGQVQVAYKDALRLHTEHALPEERLADCHFGLVGATSTFELPINSRSMGVPL